MWSGESEAQNSRYTSDNNVMWLLTGAFLIALKVWQQRWVAPNASATNWEKLQPRRSRAWVLCHVLDTRIIRIHGQWVTLLFLYICYLQRKQLPTWPFTPTETFSLVCMEDRYLWQYNPYDIMGRLPETSLKPIRIVAIQIIFVVTPATHICIWFS